MTVVQRGLSIGQPLWLDGDARPSRRYPSLSGKHQASVAIVGGGMTGALVARSGCVFVY